MHRADLPPYLSQPVCPAEPAPACQFMLCGTSCLRKGLTRSPGKPERACTPELRRGRPRLCAGIFYLSHLRRRVRLMNLDTASRNGSEQPRTLLLSKTDSSSNQLKGRQREQHATKLANKTTTALPASLCPCGSSGNQVLGLLFQARPGIRAAPSPGSTHAQGIP